MRRVAELVPTTFWPSVVVEDDGDERFVEIYERGYGQLLRADGELPTRSERAQPGESALRAVARGLACVASIVDADVLATLAAQTTTLLDAAAGQVTHETRRLALVVLRTATLNAIANALANARRGSSSSTSTSTLRAGVLASSNASSLLSSLAPSLGRSDDAGGQRERRGRARRSGCRQRRRVRER